MSAYKRFEKTQEPDSYKVINLDQTLNITAILEISNKTMVMFEAIVTLSNLQSIPIFIKKC